MPVFFATAPGFVGPRFRLPRVHSLSVLALDRYLFMVQRFYIVEPWAGYDIIILVVSGV